MKSDPVVTFWIFRCHAQTPYNVSHSLFDSPSKCNGNEQKHSLKLAQSYVDKHRNRCWQPGSALWPRPGDLLMPESLTSSHCGGRIRVAFNYICTQMQTTRTIVTSCSKFPRVVESRAGSFGPAKVSTISVHLLQQLLVITWFQKYYVYATLSTLQQLLNYL